MERPIDHAFRCTRLVNMVFQYLFRKHSKDKLGSYVPYEKLLLGKVRASAP